VKVETTFAGHGEEGQVMGRKWEGVIGASKAEKEGCKCCL
jgi:hypothetical protein